MSRAAMPVAPVAVLLAALPTALLMAGCNDPKKAPLPTAAPEPIKGLSIDDKAVKTTTHLAIGTEGEDSWRVTVATGDVTCEQLKKAYPDRPEGLSGQRFDFWLMQPLETDGSRGPWTFRSAYVMDEDGERGLTTRGAQIDEVTPIAGAIKVAGLELACQDRRAQVQWNGDVKADLCGRVPRKEEAHPQKELTLSIAGQPFTVAGATVRPQGKNFHLRLTRAPHACNSVFTEGYDFYLDVVFSGGDDEETPPQFKFISLLGDIFPDDPAGSKGKESFVLKAEEPVVGTGDVTMTLKGKIDVGGWVTKLDGSLKARRCTPM